jgi:uncharacterized coiled-coil DUF342 family protein
MSATLELLYEQVADLQRQIDEANCVGADTTDLEIQITELKKKLNAAAVALNEGKTLLKG